MISREEKIKFLHDLIKISIADGEQDFIEKEFLTQMAKLLGLTEEDILAAQSHVDGIHYPSDEMQRIMQFQRMVLMMHIDLNACENEIVLVRRIGFKLGFNDDTVNRVLEKMKHFEGGLIPPEELIDIFKVNHN